MSQPNHDESRIVSTVDQSGADLDDEHHRVAPQGARVEFADCVGQSFRQQCGVEQSALDTTGRCVAALVLLR